MRNQTFAKRYSYLLANYPTAFIVIVLVVVISCTLLSILLGKPPDFGNPIEGFVPRRTKIHTTYKAWKSLMEQTSSGPSSSSTVSVENITKERPPDKQDIIKYIPDDFSSQGVYSQHLIQGDRSKKSFFCGERPREGDAKLVYAVEDGSLMSIETFRHLCRLQTEIESSIFYEPACHPDCACRSYSYVNYVAYLTKRSTCHNVTQDDLQRMHSLLLSCYPQYSNSSNNICWKKLNGCNRSKGMCSEEVFDLFHYILEHDIFSVIGQVLTVSYVHMPQGKSTHQYYLQLKDVVLKSQKSNIKLYALDFGIKEFLFERTLLQDTFWIGVAFCLLFSIVWLYVESIFLTCMFLISHAFTVVISFTVYQFVFRISYFPVFNFLAIVILIAMGIEDFFVYWKTWLTIKYNRNARVMERLTLYTIKHTSAAMLITSTCAVGAFSSWMYIDVLAIRCFCLYACACAIVRFLLCITWIPASIILYEKYSLIGCSGSQKASKLCNIISGLISRNRAVMLTCLNKIALVSVMPVIWVPFLFLASVLSVLAITFLCKDYLPINREFQMFASSHPFEVFDLTVKSRFDFLRGHSQYLPLIFLFGIEADYEEKYFDPTSSGSWRYMVSSDLFNPAIQTGFLTFCSLLKNQTFIDVTSLPSGCFIDELRDWMSRRSCSLDPICCSEKAFPYQLSVMQYCLQQQMMSREADFRPGIIYNQTSPVAVIISAQSNIKYTNNYSIMQRFHESVIVFSSKVMELCKSPNCTTLAPLITTEDGWLLYDLQNTIVSSLHISLSIAFCIIFFITFVSTLNILITFITVISICCSILCTLAIIGLIGWHLDALESIIFTLVVGHAISSPLHVVSAYCKAITNQEPKNRVLLSLAHVGGSVLTSGLITLLSGLLLLPCDLLAYRKIGLFLVIATLTNQMSSFFLLPSLLTMIGNSATYVQVRACSSRKHRKSRQYEKTIYSDEVSSEALTLKAPPVSAYANTCSDFHESEVTLD